MKTDTYTKIILTIIAVNLSIITLKPIIGIPAANAATASNEKSYGLVPVNKDGSINVKMNQSGPIEVELVGVEESSYLPWDAIKIKSDN